ncbi:MAG TPA: DNA-formamidopyrimidine glycosylase family protein [Micromonosporaceae bacterium]|jgi:endonuclease-8|nr:DNA-formamidopyrimidine glycosylase family protein [Micromonosporaceae bacterium]
MPEGDTVWNTAHAVNRALAGQQLTGTDFRVPQLATTNLSGTTVIESTCRGKHLLLRLTDRDARALTLHSHLRMDGSWRVFRPGARWTGGPAHLIRVALRTEDAVAVGYHLHDLALIPTDQEHTLVGHLGPDLLGPDWDAAEAVRRLSTHPDTAIGEALLDQTSLAGIGNMYKSEVLYLRGVSPWTPVRDVPDLTAMVVLAQKLLAANRGRWQQTTTGSLRRFETAHVYGRRSQPCRRCGSLIRKAAQGERVTYWCPACQPAQPPQ